jgi:hypothetical protein
MSVPFPAIKPSARNFKQGTFPIKVYRALSGATVKRSFGNRAFGCELQLEFENIPDASAALVLKHYNDTQAGFERFTLSNELFAGMTTELRGYAESASTIRWEYASPPSVSSVAPGNINTVQVNLIGELL